MSAREKGPHMLLWQLLVPNHSATLFIHTHQVTMQRHDELATAQSDRGESKVRPPLEGATLLRVVLHLLVVFLYDIGQNFPGSSGPPIEEAQDPGDTLRTTPRACYGHNPYRSASRTSLYWSLNSSPCPALHTECVA